MLLIRSALASCNLKSGKSNKMTVIKRFSISVALLLFLGVLCFVPAKAWASQANHVSASIPDGYTDLATLLDEDGADEAQTLDEIFSKNNVTGIYLEVRGTFAEVDGDKTLTLKVGEASSFNVSHQSELNEVEFGFNNIKLVFDKESNVYIVQYNTSGYYREYVAEKSEPDGRLLMFNRAVQQKEHSLEGSPSLGEPLFVRDGNKGWFSLKADTRGEEGAVLDTPGEYAATYQVEFEIVAVKVGKPAESDSPALDPTPGGNTTVNTAAADTAGETGVSVPAAVVVGTGSVLAAVGAAGAAGAGRRRGEDELDEASEYRLLVHKDFGNRLRVNRPDQPIYARMEEIKPGGQAVERLDLTQQIQIFAGSAGMIVRDYQISGQHVAAFIGAESPTDEPVYRQGVISFRFVGKGGVFQNNVSFEIVGQPYVEILAAVSGTQPGPVRMIAGDQLTYKVEFAVRDFVDPVTTVQVQANNPEQLGVSWEQRGPDTYIIRVQNRTDQPPADGLGKAQHYWLNLLAHNGWEKSETQVDVYVYPPGLSVGSRMQSGYLHIDTVPREVAGGVGKIMPTGFQLQLAVAGTRPDGSPQAELVSLTRGAVVFGQLQAQSPEAEVMFGKFSYDIKPSSADSLTTDVVADGKYSFLPAQTLPEVKAVNQVILPVQVNYRGENYQAQIPLWFDGIKPDPMAGWDEEYARLQRFVVCFGLAPETALQLRDAVKSRSTTELRLLNKAILFETMNYYTQEGVEFNRAADTMSRLIVGAKIIRAFGDQAFSVLVRVYGGQVADAVLTPFKELLVDVIGECSAAFMQGQPISWENLRIGKHVDDLIVMNILAAMRDPVNGLRYAGKIAASYGIYSLVKNYVNNLDDKGNRSFYNAVTGCFKDLSATSLKVFLSRYIQKIIDDPKSFQEASGCINSIIKYLLPGLDNLKDKAALAAVVIWQKRLESAGGAGVAVVVDKVTCKVPADSVFPNGIETMPWGIRIWFKEGGGNIGIEVSLTRIPDLLWGLLYLGTAGTFDKFFDPPPPPVDPPYDPKYLM